MARAAATTCLTGWGMIGGVRGRGDKIVIIFGSGPRMLGTGGIVLGTGGI